MLLLEERLDVPFFRPSVGANEIEAVRDVLASGHVGRGDRATQFEDEFAAYVGVKHAIAVSSCTAGLMCVLRALEIGRGDEVIVPALTFVATAHAVESVGAVAVLADVDEDGQLDPAAVADAIGERTQAVIPVHYAGQACRLAEIEQLAARAGVFVLQDAAHAVGCEYRGRRVGFGADAAVFSFHATKNMTTGDGGMICTDDDHVAELVRPLTLYGIRDREGWSYDVAKLGFKANMTDLSAAVGLAQLERLDQRMKRRRWIGGQYGRRLPRELRLPKDLQQRPHGYHLYPIQMPDDVDRDQFIAAMAARGVGTNVHFKPLHLLSYYAGFAYYAGDFPVAESIYEGLVTLPLYPAMTDLEVGYVVGTACKVLEEL